MPTYMVNGHKVNFAQDPSEADIDEVASHFGSSQPQQPTQPQNRFTLKSSQLGGNYSYLDAVKDTGKTLINNFADVGDMTRNAVGTAIQHPFQTAGNIAGGALNILIHPRQTGEAAGHQFYSSMANAPTKPVEAGLALAGAGTLLSPKQMALTPGSIQSRIAGTVGSKVGTLVGQSVSKLKPTIYNDAFVSNTVKSAISKVESVIKPLREMYKQANEPFINHPVDSETFRRALNVVPKSIRGDFASEYGTQILDAAGKQGTTIGNLQKMELELKDFIQQPQFGQKISAADFNVAEATKKLKDLRLSQLPKEAQDKIRALDKKFGPAIQASNELLPKLADKNGVPNTKFLYTTFKDPSRAGMRDYMRNLKAVGIDLTPEIKNVRGWVTRQGHKEFGKRIAERAVEGGVIGGVLKAGH